MSEFINFHTLIAFFLGVALAAMVRNALSSVKAKL